MAKKKKQQQIRLCAGFAQGSCRFGDKCWFSHEAGRDVPPPHAEPAAGNQDGGIRDGAKEATIQELNARLMAAVAEREAELSASLQRANEELSRLRAQKADSEKASSSRIAELSSQNDELTSINYQLAQKVVQLKARIAHLEDDARLKEGPPAANSLGALPTGSSGAEWQFESCPGDWVGLPAERSSELMQRYAEYADGGAATVRMKSGVESYDFDFARMSQTNVRTRKQRPIRCMFDTPECWTRCTTLQNIYQGTPPRRVEVRGFANQQCNGIYTQSSFETVNGHPVWWKNSGDVTLSVSGGKLRMFIVGAHRDTATFRDGLDPSAGGLWEREGQPVGCECMPVFDPLVGMPPLMEIAVSVTEDLSAVMETLLGECTVHACPYHGPSECDKFKNELSIVRVLRVENWHLWSKYSNHRQQIKRDLVKYGIRIDATELALPAALVNYECRKVDASAGEHILFHGTAFETAVQIALEGFDFRLSRPGHYGQGAYFASQACKSHQYTKGNLHTIILSRVAVGDFAFAKKVDKDCRRPPLRHGTSRCCDSVVASPGPMPGHQSQMQTHQEFVVFDKFQAYPELIIQYRL